MKLKGLFGVRDKKLVRGEPVFLCADKKCRVVVDNYRDRCGIHES